MRTGPGRSSVCIVGARVPRFPCLSQLRSRFPMLVSGLTQQPELGYSGMLKLTTACVYRTEKQERAASYLTFTSFPISRSAPAWELPTDDTRPAQTSALSRQSGGGDAAAGQGEHHPSAPSLPGLCSSPLSPQCRGAAGARTKRWWGWSQDSLRCCSLFCICFERHQINTNCRGQPPSLLLASGSKPRRDSVSRETSSSPERGSSATTEGSPHASRRLWDLS